MNRLHLTSKNICLGVPEDRRINHIISVGKGVIAQQTNLSVEKFIYRLKIEITNEKHMAKNFGKIDKFEETWGGMSAALANT